MAERFCPSLPQKISIAQKAINGFAALGVTMLIMAASLTGAQAQSLLVNGDFEAQQVGVGDHAYQQITGWIVGTVYTASNGFVPVNLSSGNLVGVDGANWGTPPSDASGIPGVRHYLDSMGPAYAWQHFTAPCSGLARASMAFSTRSMGSWASSTAAFSWSARQGGPIPLILGPGNPSRPDVAELIAEQTFENISFSGGTPPDYWTTFDFTKQLQAGQLYTFVVKLPENANLDNASVTMIDVCPMTATEDGPLSQVAGSLVNLHSLNPDLISITKTCEAPVAGIHNGNLGQVWNCEIAVETQQTPFSGSLTVTDATTQNYSNTSGALISMASAETGVDCSAGQSCAIDGAAFDGNGTIDVQTFVETTGEATSYKAQNCSAASYLSGSGQSYAIDGNCVQASFTPRLNVTKTCDPVEAVSSGPMTLNCQITVTGSNLPTGSYATVLDGFGAPAGSANVVGGLLGHPANISSNEPWSCADSNAANPVGLCELSAIDLFNAGGTSIINTTFQFEVGPDTPQVANCAVEQIAPVSIVKEFGKQKGSRAIPDYCVAIDVPSPIDNTNPVKLESVQFSKQCATPVQGVHDGAQGYFWNCTIQANVQPTPFNGTLTILEDASNISSGQAEFVSASLPCNGIGSDMLSCVLDGNTMSQPQPLSVQLFTEVVSNQEPIKWQNCVSGRAQSSASTMNSGRTCFETLIVPPVIISTPPKLSLKKSCVGPTAFNDGQRYICTIQVSNTGGPVTTPLTLEELFTNIAGTPATDYLLALQGTTGWVCETAPFANGANCDISAADFNANNGHQISGLFLIPNGVLAEQDFQNCATLTANGKPIANAECVAIVEPTGETTFDIEKLCKPEGPRREFSKGNWVQPFACTLTVTTNGVPFSYPIYVSDAMSYGAFSGNALVGPLSSSDPWQCVQPPFAAPGQGNQPACAIQGIDFPHAAGSSTINFTMTVQGNAADQFGAENCGNIYASIPTDGSEPTPLSQSCVTIVEPPTAGKPTLDVAKSCSPAVPAANGGGPWTVQCNVTISGTGLPAGQQIRLSDELTGLGLNGATGGGFNPGPFAGNNCGGGAIAGGIATACDITTDDITNNGGSLTFPYTGTLNGPGGRSYPGFKYPQNCAFASIPGIGLNAPANGKVCVQIPIEPKAIAVLNDNVVIPNPVGGGGTPVVDEAISAPALNIFTSGGGGGGASASCSLDTLYVVDTSGSMSNQNRLNNVKAALAGAYAAFEGNGSAASLISFKYDSQILVNPAEVLPSQNLTQITQALYSAGGTNWQNAFLDVESVVTSATKKPLVFFVTDGEGGNVGIQTIASIRNAGSRIIGIIIGTGLQPGTLSNVLGPNVITADANTLIDPFTADVIAIPSVQDSLSVFQKIEEAYCPGNEKSAGLTLLAAQKALQTIPLSTTSEPVDDEVFNYQDEQTPTTPDVGLAAGRPDLQLMKTASGGCRIDRGNQTYECPFNIEISNKGTAPYIGPLVMVDDFGKGGLRAVKLSGGGWQLAQHEKIGIMGLHGNLLLAPGQKSVIRTSVIVAGQRRGGRFENCGILGVPEDDEWATMLVQQIMNTRGINVGAADGKKGPKTSRGLVQLRQQLNLPPSDQIDDGLFAKLGLSRQSPGTQSCVLVPLPPMLAPIENPTTGIPGPAPEYISPKPSVQCDPVTTVQRGNSCVCRFSRMQQATPSSCGCIRGHELIAGKGCFRPTTNNPPAGPKPAEQPETQPRPKPQTLACDAVSTRQNGNRCICKIPGAAMVSRTQCACPAGTKLDNRRGCIKVDAPRPVPADPKPAGPKPADSKPALKCDPKTTRARGDRCVCLFDNMKNRNRTSCACPSGTRFEAGVGCMGIGRPQYPKAVIKELLLRNPLKQ